jgi:uncharacterized protein DUF3754
LTSAATAERPRSSPVPASKVTPDPTRRYHAIPVSRRRIVAALESDVAREERPRFRALTDVLAAVFHYEFHAKLEALKAAYAPLAGEGEESAAAGVEVIEEAPSSRLPTEDERRTAAERLADGLADILAKGNYRALGREAIEQAFTERALLPVDVHIDLEAFEELVLYVRGESLREEEVPRWFGLRKQRIQIATYDRVCVYLRFKKDDPDDEAGRTVLKLFRNIPRADLEMLFPNTRLKMRTVDKLVIGVPALVGGVPVLAKLAPAAIALAIVLGVAEGEVNKASIIAGLSGLVGLGAFLFRQWTKFQSRKVLFMKMLSENLYFRNIDNDDGVLTRLVDEAEEEECKEAGLAYAFLLRHPGLDARALDQRIEAWIAERFRVSVDFEVEDALAKLERLGLGRRHDDGHFEVVPLDEALTKLDRRWDGFFSY